MGLRGLWRWPEAQPRYLVVVMEYVAGWRLDGWAEDENPSARQVLRLLRELSQGLPVLPLWQSAPMSTEDLFQTVVVEAEAAPGEAQGPYTLKLWDAGGGRAVSPSRE